MTKPTLRFWLFVLGGLIVLVFMFGRLVRVAHSEDLKPSRWTFDTGRTNEMLVVLQENYETNYYETNVTTGDNASGCPMYVGDLYLHHNVLNHECRPYKPATERWWTTNITKICKLRLTWRGKPEEIVRTEVVTNVTVRSRLKSEWGAPEADKAFDRTDRMLFLQTNGVSFVTNILEHRWIDGRLVPIFKATNMVIGDSDTAKIIYSNGTVVILGYPEPPKPTPDFTLPLR